MSEIEAAEALLDQWITAVNAGDIDGWSATLADDATVMPPNEPAVTGKEALGPWMVRTFFDPFNVQLRGSFDEAELAGDWVFARGSYELSLTPKNGGQVIEDSGKFVNIFKRQPDDSFKYAMVMWNSNNPPPGQ